MGLLSTLPWPELFSLDAVPGNAVVFDPRLLWVLIGHYAVLAIGGALGLVAGTTLSSLLRRHRPAAAGALVLGAGAGVMGYAAVRRAVDVLLHDGRSTLELSTPVGVGGTMVLVGTLALTLALRRHTGTGVVVLGLSAPVLVAAGITVFVVVGEDAFPEIWGVTFPPPPDYLLAVWFIVLGRLVRIGRFQHLVDADRGDPTERKNRP